MFEAKSRKYQGVFEVKSRVKTWQVRGIWTQQLEHKQVPQWGTEPGVRKGKRSLLACHNRCKCSMETTHNQWRSSSVWRSLNWWKVWLVGKIIWTQTVVFTVLKRSFKKSAKVDPDLWPYDFLLLSSITYNWVDPWENLPYGKIAHFQISAQYCIWQSKNS